jgi:hypothetical protein
VLVEIESCILYESEAFICKALKGEAIVDYASPLIIRLRRTDGILRLARREILMWQNDSHPFYLRGILMAFQNLPNVKPLNINSSSH